MTTLTKNTEGTPTADVTGAFDLTALVAGMTAAAAAAGAVVLDGVTLPEKSAAVTLTLEAQLETLLKAGAAVLYVDEEVLTADRADELTTPVVRGDRDPAATRKLDEARQQLRAHLGETASVTLAATYAGVLHTLEETAPWFDGILLRILQIGTAQLEAAEAAEVEEERAYAERGATATAWFDGIVDRLVADDTWLALTQEAARKQYVRDLAEAELGPSYEQYLPHERTQASLVNQAVQFACHRRSEVLEQRTAALTGRLPELAAALAQADGYRGATKEHRLRLAREHVTRADRLVKPAALASDLVRGADKIVASAPWPAAEPAAEPGLF